MPQIVIRFLLFVALIGGTCLLRWPTLSEGRPFFYQEDEAHHFNRTVDMVKRGSLNPEYFHKPSLHFYLRMPLALIGAWISEKSAGLNSITKIQTRDRYGLARYSFSWSHPLVVYAVRSVSLVMTVLTMILVYIVTRQLMMSTAASFFAFALLAVSPELFNYSSYIGVDVPLMFFCLLSTSLALCFSKALSIRKIWIVGLVSGLAVSCKYNGLPIALLPLVLVVFKGNWKKSSYLISAILAPTIGFFIGSPYILISYSLFYKQLSYELWHYAVAGHEGHSAEPGLAQFLHYGKWLMSDGLGASATALAGFGALLLYRSNRTKAFLFLLFPLLFGALMCAQKTNFVRNMLPILPFGAILAAFAVENLILKARFPSFSRLPLAVPLMLLSVVPPLERCLDLRSLILSAPESRIALASWINQNYQQAEIALSGAIQPQYSIKQIPGVTIVAPTDSIDTLYQQGFDYLVTASMPSTTASQGKIASAELVKVFTGSPLPMRVVRNPGIEVYRLTAKDRESEDLSMLPVIDLRQETKSPPTAEPYQWLTNRVTKVMLPGISVQGDDTALFIETRSPWKDQEVRVLGNNSTQSILLNSQDPGQWTKVKINLLPQMLFDDGSLVVVITKVSSPASRQLSSDERRLGVALKIAR